MVGFSGVPRVSARGLIVDEGGRYVLLRRVRKGEEPYLVTPGGGVGEGESMREAVRRECVEELGAEVTVGEVIFVAYQDEPAPGAVQRFYLSRLDSINDELKEGHEFSEPKRGSYETVRVAATDEQLLDLRPSEIADLVRLYHPYFLSEVAALA